MLERKSCCNSSAGRLWTDEDVRLNHNLSMIDNNTVDVEGMYGESASTCDAATVVLVTMRAPHEGLVSDLRELIQVKRLGIKS